MPRRRLQHDLRRTRTAAEERAGRLEGDVDRRREEFDPREFARETAAASFEDHREGFERGIEGLRGEQVGMGRLRIGFGGEDEDRLVEDLNRRTARELARAAFTAGGMELSNIGGIQAAGSEARTRSDAALAGELDRADAAEERRRQRRSRFLGTLGTLAGGAIGAFKGGIPGAMAGARIGGSLGNL
jgi:hypothetical protein